MLYGVDVHDGYQAGLSFPTLARQGYVFAVVKLTQGTGYVRAAGGDWIRTARSAGLIPGAYHWLTAGDGGAQARWFHRHLAAAGGPDGMLIQLDCEDTAGYGDVLAWRDEWIRLTGGHPFLLYTGAWWWQPRGWSGSNVTPHLWHSHYLTADTDTIPDDPAAFAARIPASWWTPGYGGWPQAMILQFTSRGDAGGLANKIDLNAFRGSREQLLALTRPDGPPATMTTGDDDMLVFVRVNEDGACWVSNGPTRWAFASMPDLNEALAAQGKTVADLRHVDRVRLGAYGVDVSSVDDPPFTLTDEQLAGLIAAAAKGAHEGVGVALGGATVTTTIHTAAG